MPVSGRFWSKKKKAAFEHHHRAWEPTELLVSFHGKTIAPFTQSAIKGPKARQEDALTGNQKPRMAEQYPIRAKRIAVALLIAASIGGLATPSFAQTVPIPNAQTIPIPKPAPKGRDVPMNGSDGQKGPMTTGATQAPNPIIPDPRRNVPASLFASFDDKQKAQAARVSNYLSSLQTVSGNFVQVGPDGSKTKGDFYIQKPGKVRFEYEPPSPIAIIADGSMLAVRDRKLSTQDIYPLSQTPLRYLLSDRIDLLKDTNVVSVTADDVFISVTIEEKQLLIGTSRLMLMVGAKDGQLKQWTVTDPQGYDTTVAVYNLDTSRKVDPGLFKIDFTDHSIPMPPG
jgi:outer membrane lipoprotein-sorting protein